MPNNVSHFFVLVVRNVGTLPLIKPGKEGLYRDNKAQYSDLFIGRAYV
jgi:hypothetical protein